MDKLRAAIDAYPGKQAGVAAALGMTQGAISHWVTGRTKPKLEDVDRIEKVTGISRHILREDFFGPAPTSEAA